MMNLYKKLFLIFLAIGISIGMIMGIIFSFQHGIRFGLVFIAIGAVFGLFGGFVSLIFAFLHSWTVKRMPSGNTEESIGVHHVRNIELNLPYDMAFNLCLESLSLIKNCKVQNEDRAQGKILGKAGMTWKTFGDIISFEVSKNANNGIKVEVSSRPAVRTTLIDYGKNLENVDKIIGFFNTHAKSTV